MGLRVRGLNNSLLYNYQYDQLNRLVGMDAWNRTGSAWSAITKVPDFKENIAYDPNGNILKYKRAGNTLAGQPIGMDSLAYSYIAGTNKLDHISDSVPSGNYTTDIDGQSSGNYKYDSIGQLISDAASGISNINWTVYGKIASITKGGDTTIYYTYDPGGNRISKSVVHFTDTTTTWYVRDAQGNVLSIYTYGDPAVHGRALTQTELHIYGSSRLGILKMNRDVAAAPIDTVLFPPFDGIGNNITFTRGNKLFELTNHLGNVLATVSDKRFGVVAAPADMTVAYFIPDLVSANDYYPFGSLEPYRSYAKSGAGYRYGFNGKENDNEVQGVGDQIDYGMRVYDPRAGRFLSVDPITQKFPNLTPYQFASNTPIWASDLDGLEADYSNAKMAKEAYIPGVPKILQLETFKNNVATATYNSIIQDAQDVVNVASSSKGRKEVLAKYGGGFLKLAQFSNSPIDQQYTSLKRYFSDVSNIEDFVGGMTAGSIEGFGASILARGTAAMIAKGASYMALYEGNSIINKAIEDGVRIIEATHPDDVNYLKARGAQATYMADQEGGLILLQPNAPRSHLLEEAIHHEQVMQKGNEYFSAHVNEMEIGAQDKLLRIGAKEGWSKKELDEIRGAKAAYERALKRQNK